MRRELKIALYSHDAFLEGDPKAHCLDLRGHDLTDVDFKGRDLRRANLSRSNLERADLRKVDMAECNLSGANLHCAKIKGANLSGAYCRRMFAAFVDFTKVKLIDTDLYGADLEGAFMAEAIWGETPTARMLAARWRVLPDGDLIGWKMLRGGAIAKLLIPKEAKRSNGFTRKCRAEFVKVLSIVDEGGRLLSSCLSKRDVGLNYIVGEICKPGGFDEDWKNECAEGINFFSTYEEAMGYSK